MLGWCRVIVGLMAVVLWLGALGTMALPVAAEEVCREVPALAMVDTNTDGVASVEEIRAVAPDNARLQDLTAQLEAGGVTGIRYADCEVPLDLAAMLYLPTEEIADEIDVDAEVFGLVSGTYIPLAEARPEVVDPNAGVTPEEEMAVLEEADYRRGYQLYYGLPQDTEDPAAGYDVTVVTYVEEFATTAGAARGYEFLENEDADPTAEDLPDPPDLGDEAELTRYETDESIALDLTFRHDTLNVGVMIETTVGDEPDRAWVETLAERLLARIEAAPEGEAPGLSNRVVRIAEGDVFNTSDHYLRFEGEDVDFVGSASLARLTRGQIEGPATDVYQVTGPLTDLDVRSSITLLRFPDEEDAATWLQEVPKQLAEDERYEDVTVMDEEVAVGDESVAVTATFTPATGASAGETFEISRVTGRVAREVFSVQLRGTSAPPLAAVEELAEAQAECLEEEVCLEPVEVPEGLGGAAETYESPQYGFTLTYDGKEWEVAFADENPDDPDDRVFLSNGTSLVGLTGDPTNDEGELADCVDDYVRIFERGKGNTDDTGTATDYVAFHECRWLGDELTLVVYHTAPAEAYEGEIAAREELLSGLELPDGR